MKLDRRTRIRLAIALFSTALMAFGLTGVAIAGASCHEEQTSAPTSQVDLTALCFSPTIAHVSVAQAVEFTNLDSFDHNIVGHGTRWGQVQNLAAGESLTVVFEEAGIYPYTCTIHPGMVGTILVGDGEAPLTAAESAAAADTSSLSWTVAMVLSVPVALAAVWRWSHRIDDNETSSDRMRLPE